MAASIQHKLLVEEGAKWLKKQGFPVVVTEISAAGSRERPDVVGFRSDCCAMIEAKASRADFLVDAKKPERITPELGVGNYRFFLSTPEIIHPDELPPKWGLLYLNKKKIEAVVSPKGNMWPSLYLPSEVLDGSGWLEFQHTSDIEKERAILFSVARRLTAKR